MAHTATTLETIRKTRGYTPEFKKTVADLVETQGSTEACRISGVSSYTALAWHRMAGYKARPVGAPKGNLNALGGRVANMVRHISNAARLHRAREGPLPPPLRR